MTGISRRNFLKLLGLAGTVGCSSESIGVRLPYVVPPETVIPGKPSWFATTCRQCPSGCGMLAKNRDGRIIKLEGNPENPINRGVLCPRGQAALTHLYNPDRIERPLRKTPSGFVPMTWPEAEKVLAGELVKASQKGGRIVFMTELITGPLRDLVREWTSLAAEGRHVQFETFAYEPLISANRDIFGRGIIPSYRIDRADFLISFNAGFLETWLSNVEYARQFAKFHEPEGGRKNQFVFVGPRQSMTAANADIQIRVTPGDEYLVGIGILLALLKGDEDVAGDEALKSFLQGYSLKDVAGQSGVQEETIRTVSRMFSDSKRPLAIAEGLSRFSPRGIYSAVAANLLNSRKRGTQELIEWSKASAQGELSPAAETKAILEKLRSGGVDLLLVQAANPAFSLPSSWKVPEAIEAVPTVISFSSLMDETVALSDYVFPTHTPLESWGEFSPREGVTGLLQPVMGNLYGTMPFGDLLIRSGRAAFGRERFPWKDFHELLLLSWQRRWKDSGSNQPFPLFWAKALQSGGMYLDPPSRGDESIGQASGAVSFPRPGHKETAEGRLHFVAYPTIQFYDGRMANSPWMQELPDPITQITWGGWAEIHPETAKRLGIGKGDLLELRSDSGSMRVPARPIYSVNPDTVAVPIGQGHTSYGRFASGLPGNPMAFYPAEDEPGGARPFVVELKKIEDSFPVANTDGSFFVRGREIVKTTTLEKYRNDLSSRAKPAITLPLPAGYDRKKDFYDPHIHSEYRWVMVVDLDRCIGCGACVIACYAENNVAFVGREQMLKGREMSWIRVQRYFDRGDHRVHWLVMLCQHCDSAPCESVCPIYAPQHSVDGLNNQVYNRCFGTRFCSQNDPYKVRRFNWYTWQRPWPLDLQLNPDVTVRQKGVMEKCSFCIQRITDAKLRAKEKGRLVQDGDFTTACAQTCPTNALIFGNLKNPESRVSRLIQDPRAYQVLHHLNTKPAVIYLKRIEQKIEV